MGIYNDFFGSWPSKMRPGLWAVDCIFTNQLVYAVVDDFGNLVRVPS